MMEDGIGRFPSDTERRLLGRGELTFHAAGGTVAEMILTGGLFVTRAPVAPRVHFRRATRSFTLCSLGSSAIWSMKDVASRAGRVLTAFHGLAYFAEGTPGRFWVWIVARAEGRCMVTLDDG